MSMCANGLARICNPSWASAIEESDADDLLLAVVSALIGLMQGAFFTGVWWKIALGSSTLEVGTPMFFDMGVFLVVLAVVTSYVLELSREPAGQEEQ